MKTADGYAADYDVLEKLGKGYSADDTRRECLRLNAVGIRHCDLLMLGTAGKGRGLECARASASLENEKCRRRGSGGTKHQNK